MIFVTVGTSDQPFDRLIEGVAALAAEEELIVQCGASAIRPSGAECAVFLDYESVLEHMRRARAVVTHAGVGSIMAALSAGKRPFVVPRLRELGEAIDDHQLELGAKLDRAGLVVLVRDPAALADAVRLARPAPQNGNGGTNTLAEDLRKYLLERISLPVS